MAFRDGNTDIDKHKKKEVKIHLYKKRTGRHLGNRLTFKLI